MKKMFTLLLMLSVAAVAQSQLRYFKAILQGSQEVPANASPATGVVIVKYNTATKFLDLSGDYQGFTSTVNNSHIHSPAQPGINASVLFNLTNTAGTTGTLRGTATLTAAQEGELFNGLMYVNVHTIALPAGEIRGQLSSATEEQTEYFDGRLQGAQQVPPNGSLGMGAVVAIVDKTVDSIWLTGNFSGLTAVASAAHIHNNGPVHTTGPIFLNLSFSPATSGTLHVAAPITDANQTQMLNGTTYVNIHNAPFQDGEIRAQLTTLSQTRYLKATLDNLQEVPSNSSPGRGTAIVRYNTVTRLLDLVGDYQNVTSAVNNSHIHASAPPGSNASVLFNLTNTGGTSGTLAGSATLTPAQETDLLNGLMYVNVHTTINSGGEIRGQLTPTSGLTDYLTGNFLGSQEVPPTGSPAGGTVFVLSDRVAGSVYVTGSFTGLATPATAGHLHTGPAGISGPIRVPLAVTAATSGTITGSGIVTAGFADSLMRGFVYANIHNSTFTGGEIRAQMGNLPLPLTLSYFNGFKTGNIVVLVWETSQELNLRHFEIEQQDITGVWIKKATVAATGGNKATNYRVEDVPVSGKNSYVLYRLKMLDADGKFSYSPVIRISISQSKTGLSIMPNPVTNGSLSFTITGLATDQKAAIMVADYNGRIVLQTTASTLQNTRLDISKLSSGMYKLMVSLNGTMLQESFTKY